MELPIYQVDAFTSEAFKGNPAAVVPLKEWLPDDVLQKIALENNLSETAFFIPTQKVFTYVGLPHRGSGLMWSRYIGNIFRDLQ